MWSYARLLLASGLLVAAGVLAASAPSASTVERVVHFMTPDRAIECDIFGPDARNFFTGGYGGVGCGIHRNQFRYSFQNFDLEKPSRHWSISYDQTSVGLTGRRFYSAATRVLRSGQTVRVGVFRCTYRSPTVTCINAQSGHGFALNNKTQRTF